MGIDQHRGEASVVSSVTRAAGVLALLVALGGPSSYVWLLWGAQEQDANSASRVYAAFAMQALSRSSDNWHADVDGLLDETLVEHDLPEQRRIVDLRGGVVVTSNNVELRWPRITAVVPLTTLEGQVAQLELSRSMRPILVRASIVALISAAIGLAIFATLRIVPVRALHRALDALAREQQRSRQELEQYVYVLFERAVDGIIVFDANRAIVSCNPRAAEMLGAEAGAVVGQPVAAWIDPPAAGFTVGQSETQAHREGHPFPCELTVSHLPLSSGMEHFVANLRDLTERRLAEQRQQRLANFDSLTGLPNRSLFRERLVAAMARADRSGRQMALMFLDLDRFKMINDSLGHDAGDQLLKHVANVLTETLRGGDTVARGAPPVADRFTVARLGGDEFTVIIENLSGAEPAAKIASRMMRALEQPYFVGSQELVVTTSLGLTMYPADQCSLDELLKHADMAMYRAKELGRNVFQFYDDAMNADAARRLQLETSLRHALERGEFRLHYQPKADLRSGAVTGVEALLRWQSDPHTLVAPDAFIRVLEETGLILPVGRWVLFEAARQVVEWRQSGLGPLRLAVNLSPRQLRRSDFVETIGDLLAETSLPADALELELTESMLMDGDELRITLKALSDLGVRLAIDDFGTGYSSLAYLKRFFVDTLKIDRSFVADTPGDSDDVAIISAIVALARSLNLQVVAEGVETEAQATLLRGLGCDEMQGYLLGRPQPAEQFAAWLTARGDATDPRSGWAA